VALDQEGGRVSRLEGLVGPTPTARGLAALGPESARRFGSATARAMRSLGFDLDFAPVVDLSTAEATNGIGDRSFGTDPLQVSSLAGAFLDGLQEQGVAGCLKHFPGLGPTDVDSHDSLPLARLERSALDRSDLVPFRHLAGRAAAVMVGHAHYPALEPERDLPATLSSRIVQGLLCGECGFKGLVVGDDLEMGAVAALDVDGRAAVRAMAAGCDLLLYCKDLERAERAATALARAAQERPAFAERLERAQEAVSRTAQRWVGAHGEGQAGGWEAARRELADFGSTA
jgi:beta-N-acetylhexosaminidase